MKTDFSRYLLLSAFLIVGGPLPALEEAPRGVHFLEKKLDELSSTPTSPYSQIALAIKPEKWRHAETDNFILHYRRVTEAQKVVNEIEYHLWFVAKTLGATKERYQLKSHVFIFKDEEEWKEFRSKTEVGPWAASFAKGGELFLSVRETGARGFDSHILAHETTHAVITRLYPGKRWPVWLNEGFAEYMGGASVGARKGINAGHYQHALRLGEMPIAKLTTMEAYPADQREISSLYQSSERLVRFLMNELPKERFPQFVDQVLAGNSFETAFIAIYSDRIKSMEAFERQYQRFVK